MRREGREKKDREGREGCDDGRRRGRGEVGARELRMKERGREKKREGWGVKDKIANISIT